MPTAQHTIIQCFQHLNTQVEALRSSSQIPPAPSQGSLSRTKAASSALSSSQLKVSRLVVNWCHHPSNSALRSPVANCLSLRAPHLSQRHLAIPTASLSPDSEESQQGRERAVPIPPFLTAKAAPCQGVRWGHATSTAAILHKMSHTCGIWEKICDCIARLAYKARTDLLKVHGKTTLKFWEASKI